MSRRAYLLASVVLAASGFVRADARLMRRAPELASSPDPELALASIAQEELSLREQLDTLVTKEAAAQRRLFLRGRAVYRLVRLGVLPLSGGFGSLLDHAFKMERARRALDQDLAEFRAAGDRKVAVSRKLEELAGKRAPLELARDEVQKARALSGEADDRKRSFERAFETSTGAGDYVAVYGGSLVGPAGPEGPSVSGVEGFRAMKGRLPFPIAGRAEIRNVHRSGAPGPGLEMAAPAGTAVRAVFAGRVAFADRYDPFGQIVILDHGDRYYTLMGDLASIDVRVGDDLSAGAKVGTVGAGATGARDGSTKPAAPALYFELRHGSTTIEPSSWLGL